MRPPTDKRSPRHKLIRAMRDRRRVTGVPVIHVAERAGVSRFAVRNWENGLADPTLCNFAAVVEELGGSLVIQWPECEGVA